MTQLDFLSDAWLAALAERGAALPACEGVDLIVQHEITGAPDGKVRFVIEWRQGQIARAEPGKADAPDCIVAAKAADAVRVLNGALAPEVAWMQGRLKIDGDYRAMLIDLDGWRRSEPYRALSAEMAALTG